MIDAGADVFIGGFADCMGATPFDRKVHIWRNRDVLQKRVCTYPRNGGNSTPVGCTTDLSIYWREGDSLASMSVPVDQFIRFVAPPGKLLVHCAGGHCRSVHLAVLAARVRGLDPLDVIDRINRAMFAGGRFLPGWYWEVIGDIAGRPLAVPVATAPQG